MMAAVDENTLGGYFLPAFAIPSNEPGNFMISSVITKFVTRLRTSYTISVVRSRRLFYSSCKGHNFTVKICRV